jgi:hypothetical protein
MTSNSSSNDNRNREALGRYPLSLQITARALWGEEVGGDDCHGCKSSDLSDVSEIRDQATLAA